MRLAKGSLVLLVRAACSLSLGGAFDATKLAVDTPTQEHPPVDTLANHGRWVNPEDLLPMPQCIAQQDQSAWLSTMTKCTRKICINHFGAICTRHQWLTQLSCLSVEFSPDVVRGYLPYCSRSILAKAQLFDWVRKYAGRNWLADVGDANGLQSLSPVSLKEGFAAVDIVDRAPACLTESASASSTEQFQHVMASCGFTNTSEHTGNAARPWEYDEPRRSMIALDSATAGYDFTGRSIPHGDYFDRRCFCDIFSVDKQREPCLRQDNLDQTRQRLWINATCGPNSLPANWTDELRTTDFAYMNPQELSAPRCLKSNNCIYKFFDDCETDACEVDSSGYCLIQRAVDRSCVCSKIRYSTFDRYCDFFERRAEYVDWLHGLCGQVHDWHGLPENWRELRALTAREMVPFPWLFSLEGQTGASTVVSHVCGSWIWKLASLALLAAAPLLTVCVSPIVRRRFGLNDSAFAGHWIAIGFEFSGLYLMSTALTVVLSQISPAFTNVPTGQLFLLWTALPRLSWICSLILCFNSANPDFSTFTGSLAAEWILQVLTAWPMVTALKYGSKHGFYENGFAPLRTSAAGTAMYTSALAWVIIIGITTVLVVQMTCRSNSPPPTGFFDARTPGVKTACHCLAASYRQARGYLNPQPRGVVIEPPAHVCKDNSLAANLAHAFTAQSSRIKNIASSFNDRWACVELNIAAFLLQKRQRCESEAGAEGKVRMETPLLGVSTTTYGTVADSMHDAETATAMYDVVPVRFFSIVGSALVLLWGVQCVFWLCFVGLCSGACV